jgi:hypothetical protein
VPPFGRRVGSPAGGARLRGLVELVRQLVADRLLVPYVPALGAVLLAGGGLGLVIGGVGALDGLLEPAQRRRDVRAGELLERLGREVLVRTPARRGRPLVRGDDQARRVLLGGDDDERAAVELAGRLGAVDELPYPGERGLRVAVLAVVDAQPSPGAVLARLGDVGAQLVDDETDAGGRDPGDPLAGLRIRGAVVVGAQERVDELCRPWTMRISRCRARERRGGWSWRRQSTRRSRLWREENGLQRALMDPLARGAVLLTLADLARTEVLASVAAMARAV